MTPPDRNALHGISETFIVGIEERLNEAGRRVESSRAAVEASAARVKKAVEILRESLATGSDTQPDPAA